MSSTSFRNDAARLVKEMEMSTFEGRYQLNAPGPGLDTKFNEDPHIRLQYYGGNQMTNMIDIEGHLIGRKKVLSRDYLGYDEYDKSIGKKVECGAKTTYTLESRAELPAWSLRGVDQKYERFEHLWINPQNNVEIGFNHNIQTRIMEKSLINDKSENILKNW